MHSRVLRRAAVEFTKLKRSQSDNLALRSFVELWSNGLPLIRASWVGFDDLISIRLSTV